MSNPPPPPASPPPRPKPAAQPLRPTARHKREPILDVLRGVAVLGILLVNIHLMRGPVMLEGLAGLGPTLTGADQVVNFVVGWFASGKFLSMFALMFGIGAGIMVQRAHAKGHAPASVLLRRYAWLIAFGAVHMVLLFPGDILAVYGVSGMILLAFVHIKTRTMLWWGAGLIVATSLVVAASGIAEAMMGALDGEDLLASTLGGLPDAAVSGYTEGGITGYVVTNIWQAALVQSSQLLMAGWILGLFLIGFAVTRLGWIADLSAHTRQLRKVALVGLSVGIPLNLTNAMVGPLQTSIADGSGGYGAALAGAFGATVAAPVLAAGYLAAIALLCLKFGANRTLAATGQMALSAYLLQSLIAAIIFAGFSSYGQLSVTTSLIVVGSIWIAVLAFSRLWMSTFLMGPAEWLWRRLSYSEHPSMRHTSRSEQASATG